MIRNELFSKVHVEWELLHAKKRLCDKISQCIFLNGVGVAFKMCVAMNCKLDGRSNNIVKEPESDQQSPKNFYRYCITHIQMINYSEKQLTSNQVYFSLEVERKYT